MNIYITPRFLKIIFNAVVFTVRNLHASRMLPEFQPVCLSDKYEVLSCSRELIPDIVRLAAVLPNSTKINIVIKTLLKLAGAKFCFVLKDRSIEKIIGYSLFFCNKKDIEENTIHEGYIGILPEYHGHGTGTAFRKAILKHFADCTDLYGTSSRVSLSNRASLMSNLKNGYAIKYRYFDKHMGEERVYMVCVLSLYRIKEKGENKNK